MHDGYFVGRKELTAWIQSSFNPAFQKVEDLANGVVYCQIINSVYPGALPMAKVKMGARTEVDCLHNFKLLQTAFNKKKVDRYIEVDKLTKRSFQYNMEFLQFMKCYWDMHAPAGDRTAFQETAGNAAPVSAPPPARKAAPKAAASPPRGAAAPPARAAAVSERAAAPPARAAAAPASSAQQKKMAAEVAELKLSVENLERERDFYYQKLREVEVLCQQHEDSGETPPFLQVGRAAPAPATPPPPPHPPLSPHLPRPAGRPRHPLQDRRGRRLRRSRRRAGGVKRPVGPPPCSRRGQYLCAAARL